MSASVQHAETGQRPIPTDATTRPEAPRLRIVTGNPFPRKCACGCGGQIPRDPQLRYVVDLGAERLNASPDTLSAVPLSRSWGKENEL
jgi:hypothetical protein